MANVTFLGQSGLLLSDGKRRVIIDPYLTNAVAERYGAHLRRQVPPPSIQTLDREDVLVLITHGHLDHCDPGSLAEIARLARTLRIFAPKNCHAIIRRELPAIEVEELTCADWSVLEADLEMMAVPAAHPRLQRQAGGRPSAVGYVVRLGNRLIYHSGDTSPHAEIFELLKRVGKLDLVALPVNERNFYRQRAGIIGNMSVREALQFAAELEGKYFLPLHWDMFAPNSVLEEEIRLVADREWPRVKLKLLKGETCRNLNAREPDYPDVERMSLSAAGPRCIGATVRSCTGSRNDRRRFRAPRMVPLRSRRAPDARSCIFPARSFPLAVR